MKKILIIRGSSIGDIVLTTPVVRCIKQQMPSVELHYLTKKQNAVLLENNLYIDRIHVYQDKLNDTIHELKAENFDFVVDLHKNIRSFRIRFGLKAPSAAFPKLNFKKWLLVQFKINLLPKVHIVDRYFEAVKRLGIVNDGNGLDYFIPEQNRIVAEKEASFFNQPFIAMVIGSKHQTKQLTEQKIIEICSKIEYPVVLLGDKNDFEKGERIIQKSNGQILNACGKYNLKQSASWLEQAQVVIANDTGLMHIAAALQKNIISIWGNTVPEFGMYPYLPKDAQVQSCIIETKGLKCRPCSKLGYKTCPKKHFKCINDISTDLIVAKINHIFT